MSGGIVNMVTQTHAGLRAHRDIAPEWALPLLLTAQHFEVSDGFFLAAADFGKALDGDGGEPVPFPVESRLPAPVCTLWWPSCRFGKQPSIVVCKTCGPDVWFGIMGPEVVPEWMGLYRPGSRRVGVTRTVSGDAKDPSHQSAVKGVAARIALIWTLINEPRFVVRGAPPRPQRRSVIGMGFAVDAWTRVSWRVGADVRAKVSRDGAMHNQPLHYRRGHWRRAQEHYEGAMQRPQALNPAHRALWWQWIDGYWAGHPAFGVRTHYHTPRIEGDAA